MRGAACHGSVTVPHRAHPGHSARTNSEAPWVKGVPAEVGHRRAVLDGGHGCVGETARLGELAESNVSPRVHARRGHPCAGHSGGTGSLFPPPYLEDGDLAASGEQREGDALVVGAEAVALARRGEAQPPQVGDVGVAVQHRALRVPESGAGPCGAVWGSLSATTPPATRVG